MVDLIKYTGDLKSLRRNVIMHFLFPAAVIVLVPVHWFLASAKINLSFAGLGEKKVVFQKDGKTSHVYEKLVSEFPSLAQGGGFEILRTTENRSKMLCVLPVPPGGYTVPYLKSVLGQARGFIRPLQKDLSLQEQSAFQVSLKKSMVT